MEVLRGIVAISIGILFIFLDVRFFIYALGIYLIIDGSLDTYKVAKGRRVSNRKVLSYLGSALSVLLGLICFVSYVLTILFILFIIVVRIMISSVKAIIEARQSKSRYAGLTWLYGGLLGLFVVALIISPFDIVGFHLLLLFFFISVYAICDGCYLLGKGLLLRFAPTVFTRSASQVLENQPEVLENLPSTIRRAVVFVLRM
jgi:uncharacterized membrane protein HdeD (DUF308 family)